MVELKLKKPTINQNIFFILFYYLLLLLFYILLFFIIIFLTKQMHLPRRNWVLTLTISPRGLGTSVRSRVGSSVSSVGALI